jgi:hypothetical protein
MIRIPISRFILFDEGRSIALLIESVENERLRWPVARTFRSAP